MLPGGWDVIPAWFGWGTQPARSHLTFIIPCIHLRISAQSQAPPVHQHQEGDPNQDAGPGPSNDSDLLAP